MSRTLDDLVRLGLVRQWHGELGPRRMAHRRLFLTKQFDDWSATLSQKAGTALLSERDELQAIFAEFVSGRPLANVILDVNPPAGEGIKKLKTQRFRMWGWAAAPQTLVLVNGVHKNALKQEGVRERDFGRKALSIRIELAVFESAKGPWNELFSSQR